MLFRVLYTDFRQIATWRLLGIAFVVGVTYIFVGFRFIREYASVWSVMTITVWGSTAFFTLELMPTFAFSPKIADDYYSHAVSYWIIRTGITRYTVSKIIACAAAGFITHFLGTVILFLFLFLKLPLYGENQESVIYALDWMNKGQVIWGFLGFMTDKAIGAALVAALGMVVSIFFIHPYVAVASPLVVMLTMSRIVYIFHLPEYLNPPFWTHVLSTANSALEAILTKIILLIVMIIVFCIIGTTGMKRRVSNA